MSDRSGWEEETALVHKGYTMWCNQEEERVIYEADDSSCTISEHQVWIPGIYENWDEAVAAFSLTPDEQSARGKAYKFAYQQGRKQHIKEVYEALIEYRLCPYSFSPTRRAWNELIEALAKHLNIELAE